MNKVILIKEKVEEVLKNFVIDKTKDKSLIEQVEDKIDILLNPLIGKDGLTDYWISSKINKAYKTLDTRIGLQYGEHDKAEIHSIDCITHFLN